MFVTFTLIKIKIKKEIDISKDELLETMWEHKKRKNKLIITPSTKQRKAQGGF
jgi:hypothetical protein